jgi:hypothetical protein
MSAMIEDIKVKTLLIILLFMFAETLTKPKFIKHFIDDYPIFKWIILYLIIMKKENGFTYFLVFFALYQVLYLVDVIYFEPEPIEPFRTNKQQKLIKFKSKSISTSAKFKAKSV